MQYLLVYICLLEGTEYDYFMQTHYSISFMSYLVFSALLASWYELCDETH